MEFVSVIFSVALSASRSSSLFLNELMEVASTTKVEVGSSRCELSA